MITKKDLFRILIKLFGVYLIIETLFSALPSNLFYFTREFDLRTLITILAIIALTIYIFSALTFNPDKIIKWLKLDQGFDTDDIHINQITTDHIFKLAIILIGGHLIIQEIPIFLSHVYFVFKSSAQPDFMSDFGNDYTNKASYFDWVVSGINLLIGYLLVTNFKKLSDFFNKKIKE